MNNDYLYEVSCYDCINCRYNRTLDNYCYSSCQKCQGLLSPRPFNQPWLGYMNRYENPWTMDLRNLWINPSQFPYGNYYGRYIRPSFMY